MTNDAQTAGGSDFKDRKAGLIVFGILRILSVCIKVLKK